MTASLYSPPICQHYPDDLWIGANVLLTASPSLYIAQSAFKFVYEDNMKLGDWANSAVNLVIGVLLGWSANGLIGLMTSTFWPLAIIIPVLFIVVLLLDGWFSAAVDKVFPTGVKPAATKRRNPLARRLSLPLGFAIGLVVARLGFGLPFLTAI